MLEVAAGSPLPAERSLSHRVGEAERWSVELEYRAAGGVPLRRRLPLLLWDGRPADGHAVALSLWVSPHRAAFVEIAVADERYRYDPIALPDGLGRLGIAPPPSGGLLVERGVVSAATPTPEGLRLVTACDACAEPFAIRPRHAGHAELDFFYCDRCPRAALVSRGDPKAIGFWSGLETRRLDLVDDPSSTPEAAVRDNLAVYAAIEAALRPCPCGGRFRFLADLRAPCCAAPYTAFRGDLWRRLSETHVALVRGVEPLTSDIVWR